MNPRVSRSSALASKATGYPIAKVAAKLAVGYTLDEIPNDITGNTPASFEPVIDYCVVKIPRWAFEKFPEADETLTTQMKSVGEAMAIGRTFKEAFQKCVRSMEIQRAGYGLDRNDRWLAAAHERHAAGDSDAYRALAERDETGADWAAGRARRRPDTDESTADLAGRSIRTSWRTSCAAPARAGPTTSATRSSWAGPWSRSTSSPTSIPGSSSRWRSWSSSRASCSRARPRRAAALAEQAARTAS